MGTHANFLHVKELVDFSATHFGIDRSLMEKLALGRADENGFINISDLLDPAKFPAHRGSLARIDATTAGEFSQVDVSRLDVLTRNSNYSIVLEFDGQADMYISYKQLKKYQTEFCWAQSEMNCLKDCIPAKAEVHLLWALFGAYRVQDSHGTDLIPIKLVDNFLRNSRLPENFKPNITDPATLASVAWAILTE